MWLGVMSQNTKGSKKERHTPIWFRRVAFFALGFNGSFLRSRPYPHDRHWNRRSALLRGRDDHSVHPLT